MIKKNKKENLTEQADMTQSAHDQLHNDNESSKASPGKEEKHRLDLNKKLKESEAKVSELQDKYLRLSAEFDNYRKRTLKERVDLLRTAGEESLLKVLPVMDDIERALNSMDTAKDVEPVKEGIRLIHTKFKDILAQQGLKEIESIHHDFNTDIHEAITKVPAPDDGLKGKVLEVIQKGYYLNEKVIRFAKVIIGE